MKKSALALLVSGFIANATWGAVHQERIVLEIHQTPFEDTGFQTYTGTFDLTGKELINGNTAGVVPLVLDRHSNVSVYETCSYVARTAGCIADSLAAEYSLDGDTLNYALTGETFFTEQYGSVAEMDVTVQFSFVYPASFTFDPQDRSINLNQIETGWMDIHLSINGGAQHSYRMLKDDNDFKHVLQLPVANGDSITYSTTYLGADGFSYTSGSESFEVEGLTQLLTTSFDQNSFLLESAVSLDWVVIHYSIDGSGYYNRQMSGSNSTFTQSVVEMTVQPGQVINYYYTYSRNGQATDTNVESLTVQ